LGEGAYGKVYLVKKKTTGDLYAMKIIDYADKVHHFKLNFPLHPHRTIRITR